VGANGNREQERCHRGHKLIEPNTKPGTGGGRRCRACECALSASHNALHRHGNDWDESKVQDYADLKYSELVTNARS
jgi:hypothetical protein